MKSTPQLQSQNESLSWSLAHLIADRHKPIRQVENKLGRILLIEDELVNQKIVTTCLSQHEMHTALNLHEARVLVQKHRFDLVLLDVNLPDGDGFSFILELQNAMIDPSTPIVLLTGQNKSSDQVTGYSMGADDYITKPIDPLVFRARIEARLRKHAAQGQRESVIKIDGFTLFMDKQTASYETAKGAVNLDFTALEFKLLAHFLKHKDHVLSRDQLIEAVWGTGVAVTDRTVDSHVSHLRKYMVDSQLTIQSVYGAGYKLTSQVAEKKAA